MCKNYKIPLVITNGILFCLILVYISILCYIVKSTIYKLGADMSFTEDLTLPSRGIIYRIPDFDGVVHVKPFTTRLYKDLLASNASESGLRQLIEGCLVNCPVKAKDMNQEDLLAVLFKTRIMTLGNTLKSKTACPDCEKSETIEYDLNDIEVNYLYTDKYPIPVTLPCGQEIKIRFQTGADTRKAEQEAKRRANMFGKKEDEYLQMYNTVALLDVGGKDIVEKAEWYEGLNPRDAIYIDSAIAELNGMFGVKMTREVVCPECDRRYFTYISIGSDFFRPDRNIVTGVTSKVGNLAGTSKESDSSEQKS